MRNFLGATLSILLTNGVHAGVNQWTNTGPAGRLVFILAIDPKTPTIVYAGTDQGVFKSSDGGASWSPKNIGLTDGPTYAVIVDPDSPVNVYAATSAGVFRSLDAGETWKATSLTTPISVITIAPNATQILYAAEDGIYSGRTYVSTDRGQNWTPISNGLSGGVQALTVAPTDAKTVYAAVVRDGGRFVGPIGAVFQTANGGLTWSKLSMDFLSITPSKALVIDPLHSPTMYLGTTNGVYKSEDGGREWKPTGLPLTTSALVIDPRNPTILYAGTTSGVFQSTDGGVRWTSLNKGFVDFQTTGILSLAIDPQTGTTLYAGVSEEVQAVPVGRGIFIFQASGAHSLPILATFESPEDGQAISGITVIRGWAFATQPNDQIRSVDLYLYTNDRGNRMLCCSERKDVQNAFPQFPLTPTLNSGWGAIFNWGTLGPGRQTVRVGIRTWADEVFFTESHTVQVVGPVGFEFLDVFSLATADVRIEQDALVLNGVVIRDKISQQQKRISARFQWFTNSQSLGMTQVLTEEQLSPQASAVIPWLASVTERLGLASFVTSAQAATTILGFIETPEETQPISGISMIRGWAFHEDSQASIIPMFPFAIDGAPRGTILCCSVRVDVGQAFPTSPAAFMSGWGIAVNYGVLSSGAHVMEVQLEDTTGLRRSLSRNFTVVRIGGFEFVDQLDLTSATAHLEGENIVLNGVQVRDKMTQQTKQIDVRLQWFVNSQSLGIVASS
jgi:hypothetical protein